MSEAFERPGRRSASARDHLSNHLKNALSYLVGEQIDAPDADVEISRMFRQARGLDPGELEILDGLMQSLLKRRSQSGGG